MISRIRSQNPSENLLVTQASQGNMEAFNSLVLLYQNMLYNHAFALLGDPDSAADATQESFIKAFQGLHGFRGGSFRSWLMQIASNSAYDIMRKSKRHPIQPLFPKNEDGDDIETPAWIADPNTSVQATIEQHELSKCIYKALDELPNAYRSVITLVDLYELDYLEAAEILKVPLGTIKSRLARARLQMKESLRENKKHKRSFNVTNVANAGCAA